MRERRPATRTSVDSGGRAWAVAAQVGQFTGRVGAADEQVLQTDVVVGGV